MCPAEGRERTRHSAGNTNKRKTCSQQKGTRIKRFWSKHFRQRNKTIFTEYDRKKSRLSSVNIILFLCLKACYVPAFLLGTSLANLCAPWVRRVLVHALLPGTRRCIHVGVVSSIIHWTFHFSFFFSTFSSVCLGICSGQWAAWSSSCNHVTAVATPSWRAASTSTCASTASWCSWLAVPSMPSPMLSWKSWLVLFSFFPFFKSVD